MPCGFLPAGHWGFPRRAGVVNSSIDLFAWLKTFSFASFVSFGHGLSSSTAPPTSTTLPPDPRFSGDWAAAVEKDKARRAE